ncbi:MAG: DJ-1/PfpI family protein, partial [Bacteroidales bacterium]|nr:DJ-1/PfpI family protein [Bacteroidales bacterium]
MKKALILLAPGFETIEATTPMDVLRRCQIPVVVISVNGEDKHG